MSGARRPAPSIRPVLGVACSTLGRAWHARLDDAGLSRALSIVQAHGHPDLLARVLAGRGVGVAEAEDHLAPTLRRAMPDPDGIQGMGAAVARLAAALGRAEAVGIIGDYDVDGAASAALLSEYLRAAGIEPRIHIPDRIAEGYGPNVEAVRAMAAAGTRLLVTVDCGSMSAAPLAEAARLGLDTIVIDHHQVGAELPLAVAVVNPNRPDDLSGLGHLCAAGVVFMVLVALNRALKASGFWAARPAPDLLAGLDLVALATVADVVPLTGLNRVFVTKGLAVARERQRPGLAALLDVARADGPPSAFHLGFLVGPRINAGGRIGDAALGSRLLSERDPDVAARLAADLDRLNRERRVIEGVALEEAEALASAVAGEDGPVVVAASEGWHPGVMGLVAARLRERFDRPAFAIALADGVGTGSGRSIPGVDLGRVVRAAVEAGLLRKGGGHAMAAGVTLDSADLPAFRAFLAAHLSDDVAGRRAEIALSVDAVLLAAAVTPDLVRILARAGPFGAGNPEPVVVLPNQRIGDVAPVGDNHVRLTLVAPDGTRLRAIAFRAGPTPLGEQLRSGSRGPLHLAGTLALDRWGGGDGRAELRVLDAAVPDGGA